MPLVCPQSWYPFNGNKCVRIFDVQTSFEEAQTLCAEYGATLVSLHSEDEVYAMNALIIKYKLWGKH